jgi:NAD-dependent deacetylase
MAEGLRAAGAAVSQAAAAGLAGMDLGAPMEDADSRGYTRGAAGVDSGTPPRGADSHGYTRGAAGVDSGTPPRGADSHGYTRGVAEVDRTGDVGAPRSALATLARLVLQARSVVALTGAGISVPSGIPDFRTPGTGLWERVDPMEVAHIDAFREDPVRFWRFYGERFATLGGKLPNGAHRALVAMERHGLLDGVITQNVDMLHRRAGTEQLVEVHGSIASCSCPACGGEGLALEQARARLAADAEGVPRCDSCGGPLKPDVVLFGEMLDPARLQRARALCERADLLLCVGSSLEVHPVAGLPLLTREAGGSLAIITQGPTPLDELAAVRLSGDVEAELQALARAVGVDPE